jgi:hypothetical protein
MTIVGLNIRMGVVRRRDDPSTRADLQFCQERIQQHVRGRASHSTVPRQQWKDVATAANVAYRNWVDNSRAMWLSCTVECLARRFAERDEA